MARGGGEATEAVARALRLLSHHSAVAKLFDPSIDEETGAVMIEVGVRVALPNAWNADGISPNGVHAVEPVTFIFPAMYPLRAPTIYLRRDFDRSLAHVQPGSLEDPPEPCIVDGRL